MNVRKTAINYIKALTARERENLKIMLEHGIMCGADFARENGIEPNLFSAELKNIFKE
jgi:hypothetical protein